LKSARADAVAAAWPIAEAELDALRLLSYDELLAKPNLVTVEIPEKGLRVTLTTYVDVLTNHDSAIQVVAQLIAHGGFSSNFHCRGFRLSRDGACRELVENELWEYT